MSGKAERFIRIALEKWADVRSYRSSRERTPALPVFLAWYNTVRTPESVITCLSNAS